MTLNFTVGEKYGGAPSTSDVHLEMNDWDDFGYKILYNVQVKVGSHFVEIGAVRILDLSAEKGRTNLPKSFTSLPGNFVSLGKDITFYEQLASMPQDARNSVLAALNDLSFNPSLLPKAKTHDGFVTALVRFGEARHALATGGDLLRGDAPEVGTASFTYSEPSTIKGIYVVFNFGTRPHIPGRMNVIIGYNGSGKTRLLARIANAMHGSEPDATISGPDATSASIVAVSYSAFDTFDIPEYTSAQADRFGYKYCGLRKFGNEAGQLKSPREIVDELVASFRDILRPSDADRVSVDREASLKRALEELQFEPSFGRAGINLPEWILDPERAEQDIETMSTGHKIVLNIVVQMISNMQRRSLALIDEPEMHLHPSLQAALIKTITLVLDDFDSFAIVATHSPVIIQEIPSEYVKVLARTRSSASAKSASLETFGAGIGEITREIYCLDSSRSDHTSVLTELAKIMDIDAVEAAFGKPLSAQARALFRQLQRNQTEL